VRTSGQDFFIIKPDKDPAMFSYAPGIGNLKFGCIASAFTKEAGQGQVESLIYGKNIVTITLFTLAFCFGNTNAPFFHMVCDVY